MVGAAPTTFLRLLPRKQSFSLGWRATAPFVTSIRGRRVINILTLVLV
jgi:hypothetical protein